MSNYEDYRKTDVDNFLLNDFPSRFEDKFLSLVNNTKLSFSLYNSGDYNNFVIDRKFCILSFLELNTTDTWQNNSKNKTILKYFEDDNKRIAKTMMI